MNAPAFALAVLLAAPLAAQDFVSPAVFTNREGNFRNGWPWQEQLMRYQQIHGDMRSTTPRAWRAIAFRADEYYSHYVGGPYSSSVYGSPRNVEIEMRMGNAVFASRTNAFDTNYLNGTGTVVVTKKNVSLPDYRPGVPSGVPTPWDFVINLDQPWSFAGTNDIAWDVKITGNSLNRVEFYPVDGFLNCTNCDGVYNRRYHGLGCMTNTSGANWFKVDIDAVFSRSSTGFIELAWQGYRAPASSMVALNIGLTNPNLSLPGLCTNLYATPVLSLTYRANQMGRFRDEGNRFFLAINSGLQGARMFVQAAAIDSSQPGLPIALSQGLEMTVPVVYPEHNVRRIYDNSAGAPNNPTGSGPYGSGIVTKFVQ